MSCRRAFEIDLVAFLAAPRDPAHDAFRHHYPTCPECAAEVRAWTELEAALATGAPRSAQGHGQARAWHPEPRALAALATGAAALDAQERRALEAHLAACAPCRDELATLRALGTRRFAERPAEAAAASPAPPQASGARWGAALRRLLWSPAFAYAVLLAVALPLGWRALRAPAPRPTILAQSHTPTEPEANALRASETEETPARSPAPARAGRAAAEAPKAGGTEASAGAATAASAPAAKAETPAPPTPATPLAAPPTPAPAFAAAKRAREPAAGTMADALEAAPPIPSRLRLRPDAVVEVSAREAGPGVRLLVPVPAGAATAEAAGAGWRIRVEQSGGPRRLEEPGHATDRPDVVEVRIPPGWLAPGDYRVLLLEGGSDAVRGDVLRMRVEPR